MIPQAGLDYLNLHLREARAANDEVMAERLLIGVEGMVNYALVCGQAEPREHIAWVAMIALVRAERTEKTLGRLIP